MFLGETILKSYEKGINEMKDVIKACEKRQPSALDNCGSLKLRLCVVL